MTTEPAGGTARKLTVAVINSNEDIVEMLRLALQEAGFETVTAHVPDIKRGREDFLAFIERHDPAVIVYDIAPPYEENWKFLHLLQNLQVVQGRGWVVTTTNKAALDALVGASGAWEIIGKPYDIDQIARAARKAAEQRERGGPRSTV